MHNFHLEKRTIAYLNSVCFAKIIMIKYVIKVPLTPKCFLNRNKTLFGVDYFGKKISAIGRFLDFL